LEKLDLSADVANNGQEAVELASLKQYHIIFMDLEMPLMDGRTAAMMIRNSALSAGCWIIALTAQVLDDGQKKIYEHNFGFSDFLTKPLRSSDLMRTLESTIPHLAL